MGTVGVNEEEEAYLRLVRDILENGHEKGDRTGTGTKSLFGRQLRFDLSRDSLPLLTTKRVYWKSAVKELLWFLSGSTNANQLAAQGVHIWDGNSSREFLDSVGLGHREQGDLGPVYGFQWRHFGASYTDMHADYSGQGLDQIQRLIDILRTNPDDRRMVVSAWNPPDLHLMALPPCHLLMQFYVAGGRLSCQFYQRSADVGLGVPFNIASYACLTRMIAHVVGLQAGELIQTMGDTHIYRNHTAQLELQASRAPRPFPTLRFARPLTSIDQFRLEDFLVTGYNPHPHIPMEMAV